MYRKFVWMQRILFYHQLFPGKVRDTSLSEWIIIHPKKEKWRLPGDKQSLIKDECIPSDIGRGLASNPAMALEGSGLGACLWSVGNLVTRGPGYVNGIVLPGLGLQDWQGHIPLSSLANLSPTLALYALDYMAQGRTMSLLNPFQACVRLGWHYRWLIDSWWFNAVLATRAILTARRDESKHSFLHCSPLTQCTMMSGSYSSPGTYRRARRRGEGRWH